MSVAMEQHQPQQGRPRSKSTFSFKSQNSDANNQNRKNSESGHSRKTSDPHKLHLTASGKADPNAAMNEVQPSMWRLPIVVVVVPLADIVYQSPLRSRSPRFSPYARSSTQTKMGI